ncbi:TAP42-like protein [Gautieria morchelliformis]|nr:TAP42-like protein [Gautieria morchelliformis]
MSLRGLFSRALQSASKAQALPTMDNETQDLVLSSLRDLEMLGQGIDTSGMFSTNESLEDLATRHLPYLLVKYVAAEMESRIKTTNREERMKRLGNSQRDLQSFLHWVHQYDIISEEQQKLYFRKLAGIRDPAKRRELKITQFKAEKELRNSLEFGLVASMLPLPDASERGQQADDDNDDDETLRDIYLLVIRLVWVQAQSQLESMEQELELLHSAPPLESEQPQTRAHEDETWRLDLPVNTNIGGSDGKGPLMDSRGRPLRPFTILPAGTSSDRVRMQAEVFRPDHRLPTMTMDEYLEEERRRGNIITGGGPQSQHAPTRTEQLTLDSEMDGTGESELKAEEKRQEEERWARYTDIHPKGEGNTMNRG